MFELHHLTAVEQWEWLRRGDVTPIELVDHYLERIERLNPSLGAFATVTANEAHERAADLEAHGPTAAPLWGVPFADKDLTNRRGVRTTFGSRLFKNYIAETSDEIVTVFDNAGAVSLGKTHAPEFGMSSYTESHIAPPARTPWNRERGAGGSSGGAAVAVAAGLLPFAPGSDGGGSIRIPAAATGLVGLKPSRGRIPAGAGLTSLGGLVVPGPITRTVADAGMVFDAMMGTDSYPFATTAPTWNGGAYMNAAVRGDGRFNLGVMTSSPWDHTHDISVSAEASAALAFGIAELSAIGHGIEDIALEPDPSYAPAFTAVWQAGAATIPAEREQLELLEPLTRWLLEKGRALSATQLSEALFALTNYERRVIRQFSAFDAVITPALALTPRPIGWYDADDPEKNFVQQVLYTPWTSFVNVSGLPAITLPVWMTPDGLPMGIQIIGRPGGEHTLLALGAQLERRIGWHRRHPPQW